MSERENPWAVLVCYGSMTCLAIAVNLAPVYLTTFAEAFAGPERLTAEQLGRIPAVIFAATVVGILVSGPLADRFGGKLFAMLGLAFTIVGLCVLGTAGSYGMLLAAGAVMGFGGGILDMVLSPIVCALRPHDRARTLNHLHAFYCIGALGTVLAASLALRLHIPWRVTVFVMTAVPLTMFIGFLRLAIPPFIHESAERTRTRALLTRPLFLALLVAIALCGAAEQGMSQWLPAYAELSLGFSKTVGALALAGFSVGMIFGRFGAGAIARHTRPLPIMLVACGACVLCYLAGCLLPYPKTALIACIAVGIAVSCLWPTALGIAADYLPHGGATMFSLMAASGNAGCFAMPWLVGVIAQYTSLTFGLVSTAVCPVLLIALLLAIARHHAK